MRKKDKIEDLDINYELLENAISGLSEAFLWNATKEGFDYWKEVIGRLREIRDLPRKCSKCGQMVKEK